MGKKSISKHSRAARRGEAESHEAKELQKVAKQESEVKKSIIRNSILSENLLAKKLESKRNKKNKVAKNVAGSRARTSNMNGILSAKIQNSVARYNFIKTNRKSGWDKINDDIRRSSNVTENTSTSKSVNQQEEEDEYVKQFFEGSGVNIADETKATPNPRSNMFALLEENDV
ncbi:60S ribosomal protein subunit export [Yamadazyma tenuis]|uniref:Uncharacterized protein n=1 Tax=Candida tenuis (strain ATCC 10573 / BCRC 21748 / CBS 615 / JCM 9827 / NBRC 10315 / NRRL Y-1498 / VKM Y-70) TaxID=590646 RepID=G3B3Y4_CANTC|nr:uncharacterized protein CANTEDRAFT_113916 [Yamadazyma tenuis ATCC 10573]XP_006686600.1 uncharacterized protein CANTEDRAFT_113916 [Yamadazyma tenuis ATCC 10573]EGV64285.1 hypothetical protein CANTEDRAFT_113916 [Yamadazyma tenuis ATCC 10573]EGV64286.1 hypothetical protein CANTEDRAFT_113916 [Yamadazyma tenuis ATCC 10573]WEJ96492.1 60S ribosomal protein subunit export [Yamadazyma tenuis]